ncbi:hypothetical protein VNI00_003287 [Paramarasmius palmivorus]|uniref:Uncharacterized protein n=1 Tax=Paramarasmius palmivorus TaxID=297713 RepID=A0AAW0DT93_9AGAR
MLSTHSINYPVNNDAISPSSSHPMAHFMPSPSTSVPTMPSPWLPVPDPGPGLISPSQSTSADYLPRAGSPVSLSEQTPSRMLQVTNGAPPSTTGRGITVVSSPYSSGYTPGGYNVTNPDADSHTNLLPLVDTKTNVAATSGVDAARDRSGATDVKGRRSSLDLNEGGPSGVWDHANASAPTLRHTRQDSEPPPPAYSL